MTYNIYPQMKYGSVRFAIGEVFEIGSLEDWEPQFVEVQLFLNDNGRVSAIVQHLLPGKFEPDFACFPVTCGHYEVVDFTSLEHKYVLPCLELGDNLYVSRMYSPAMEYD